MSSSIIGWNPGSVSSSNPGSDPSSNPGSDPSSNPGPNPNSKFRYPQVTNVKHLCGQSGPYINRFARKQQTEK